MEFLHSKNILSAPVLDVSKESSASWREKYTGILDVVKCMPEEMKKVKDLYIYVCVCDCNLPRG